MQKKVTVKPDLPKYDKGNQHVNDPGRPGINVLFD